MSIDPLQLALPMTDAARGESVAEDIRRQDLETAARQFETYMTQVLIREMRKTVPEGIFTTSAMETFGGILDEEISSRISETGQIGLAAQLMEGLAGDGAHGGEELHPSLLMAEAPPPRTNRAFMAYADASGSRDERLRGRLPVHGRLTSRFGWRTHPISGHRHHHDGIDIAAPTGTPIDAARSGVVQFAGSARGYGNLVIIDHGNGLTSRYAHCDEISVSEGDRVRSGESIATVGSTGRSTGPHLHFEVRQDDEAVDPRELFGWHR